MFYTLTTATNFYKKLTVHRRGLEEKKKMIYVWNMNVIQHHVLWNLIFCNDLILGHIKHDKVTGS